MKLLTGYSGCSTTVNAVSKGKVGRRVARRAYGKESGRLARKLFR